MLRLPGDTIDTGVSDHTADHQFCFDWESNERHIPLSCAVDISHRQRRPSGAFWPSPSYIHSAEVRVDKKGRGGIKMFWHDHDVLSQLYITLYKTAF